MSEIFTVRCIDCHQVIPATSSRFDVGPNGAVKCWSCWKDASDKVDPRKQQPTPATGLQTPIEESYTAIPPLALAKVARVMASGTRKYGPRNWDRISVNDHLDHAIRHGYLYVMGDTVDEPTSIDHLAHMACRALMALEVEMIRQADEQRKADEKRHEDDLLRCYNNPTNGNGDI